MKIKVVNQRLYLEPPKTAEGTREYLRVFTGGVQFLGRVEGADKDGFLPWGGW